MFKDRIDAGEQLSEKLKKYEKSDSIILGIPRGGVVVASAVSKILHLPLDVIIIKKIGLPGNDEFAIGAASPDIFSVDQERIKEFNVDENTLDAQIELKQKEASERYDFLSKDREPCSVEGKNVILVDDGIATGETMSLAIKIIRKQSPKKIIVAVPVASEQTLEKMNVSSRKNGSIVPDEVVCVLKPKNFGAIGEFYSDFLPVDDLEVKKLLRNG